jgi:hypothetical protein
MRLHTRLTTAVPRCCLLLAMALPLAYLDAQTSAAPASKPKVKLAPRPLPGTSASGRQSGPNSADIETAEAEARAKVPLFRPASVTSPSTQAQGANYAASQPQDMDRARIVLIRRRGTFPIPQTPVSEAPVLVNDSTARSASPTEAVPAALPPGKIRVIPKDSVKLGTPAPTP